MNWILELVAILVVGAVLGRVFATRAPISRWASRAMAVLVYPLVFVQGVVIGRAPGLLARLPDLGFQALVAALLALFASACVAWLLLPHKLVAAARETAVVPGAGTHPLVAGARVLGAVAMGVVLGYLGGWPEAIDARESGAWLLRLLVAVVGLELGAGDGTLERAVREGPRLLLVPAAALLGTAIAGFVLWLWLGKAGLTAAAGLGWYTLAGAMATEALGAEAGALAFLASLFRELSAVALMPLLVSRFGGLAAVAATGAPAMDTSLPFLVRAGGNGLTLPALVSGGLCSLLAPWVLGLALAW
jgi:uncharacterized membrane protein YbjE (DUF340 family)